MQLECACGQVGLEVKGAPIASVECCCVSCRTTAELIQKRDGAPQILTRYGAVPYVMYRKDRVCIVKGAEGMNEIRMSDKAKTRRVIATCCNTPMFLEFSHGHWLSIYAGLWPDDVRPAVEMRTMASDVPAGVVLPDDVPNAQAQSFRFFRKLLWAWIAMGFRVPKVAATEDLDRDSII